MALVVWLADSRDYSIGDMYCGTPHDTKEFVTCLLRIVSCLHFPNCSMPLRLYIVLISRALTRRLPVLTASQLGVLD